MAGVLAVGAMPGCAGHMLLMAHRRRAGDRGPMPVLAYRRSAGHVAGGSGGRLAMPLMSSMTGVLTESLLL